MRLKRTFFLTFSFFLVMWGFVSLTAGNTAEGEIQQIDKQISELQEKKRGFEGRALRHEDLAEYLQFDQQAVLETRRHIQIADENWARADRVQQEIDKLEARRLKLVKQVEKGR